MTEQPRANIEAAPAERRSLLDPSVSPGPAKPLTGTGGVRMEATGGVASSGSVAHGVEITTPSAPRTTPSPNGTLDAVLKATAELKPADLPLTEPETELVPADSPRVPLSTLMREWVDADGPWLKVAAIRAGIATLAVMALAAVAAGPALKLYWAATPVGSDGIKRPPGLFGTMFPEQPAVPAWEYFEGRHQLLILLVGIDEVDYLGRTDTIMLANVDFDTQQVKLLSIPRDTMVRQGRHRGWGRINSAAGNAGDLGALKAAVEGFITVPIDYMVAVNYDGFKQVIDALGPVAITIEKGMHYTDRRGHLTIDFEPGPTQLDGQKAMEYCRFRHDAEGDFARIRRQQHFLAEVKKQKLNAGLLLQAPELIPAIQAAITSSEPLSYDQLMALIAFSKDIDPARITAATIPCYGAMSAGASVQVPDYEATRDLLQLYFSNQPLDPIGSPEHPFGESQPPPV